MSAVLHCCVHSTQFIGTTGTIQHIADSGVLLVSYPGNAIFHINPAAVIKVNVHTCTVLL